MLSSVFGGAAGVDLLLVVSRGHVGTGSPCYAGTTKSRYTPVFRILRIDLRIRPVDRLLLRVSANNCGAGVAQGALIENFAKKIMLIFSRRFKGHFDQRIHLG